MPFEPAATVLQIQLLSSPGLTSDPGLSAFWVWVCSSLITKGTPALRAAAALTAMCRAKVQGSRPRSRPQLLGE